MIFNVFFQSFSMIFNDVRPFPMILIDFRSDFPLAFHRFSLFLIQQRLVLRAPSTSRPSI